jgi:esterase/lipase
MKILKKLVIFLTLLIGLYLIGPQVASPDLSKSIPQLDYDLPALSSWIESREAAFENIKPNNESKVVFFDSIPKKTPYSILYLHGFSASTEEGNPVHINLSNALGANIYLPRLFGHGLVEEEPMIDFTADKYLDNAREALAVAKLMGDQVIVVASSNGGTLGLLLGDDPQVAALVLYSANVGIVDPSSKLLTLPWGLEIARLVLGENYYNMDKITEAKKGYWTTQYRIEPLLHIQKLIEVSMNPITFSKITAPVFLGYYYKNEEEQDDVVSVAKMLEMFDQLGTPAINKTKVAFPDAGDHVISSYLTTSNHHQVEEATLKFLKQHLNLNTTD